MRFSEILQSVKDRVGQSPDKPAADLIEALAREEQDRRTGLLRKALNKHRDASKEIKKLKADFALYDEDGNETSTGYTKEQRDKLKNQKEIQSKLDDALAKALNGDWSQIEKLAN